LVNIKKGVLSPLQNVKGLSRNGLLLYITFANVTLFFDYHIFLEGKFDLALGKTQKVQDFMKIRSTFSFLNSFLHVMKTRCIVSWDDYTVTSFSSSLIDR